MKQVNTSRMSPKKKTSPELPYLSQDTKVPNKFTYSPKRFKDKLSKKIFFQTGTHNFFSNSHIFLFSKQQFITIIHLHTKNTKKKTMLISSMLKQRSILR
jgi:hypothetical protein